MKSAQVSNSAKGETCPSIQILQQQLRKQQLQFRKQEHLLSKLQAEASGKEASHRRSREHDECSRLIHCVMGDLSFHPEVATATPEAVATASEATAPALAATAEAPDEEALPSQAIEQ